MLDKFEGNPAPRDGDRPEDWLASTTRAVNPGLEPMANEGLAHVPGAGDQKIPLQQLFDSAPEYYFGESHVKRFGTRLGFLAKLLDSSMRLHVQAHPTAAFAREFLGSPWGKLETYVIIAARDESAAYIRLGFQRPPSPEEWRRIVMEQDIPAMDACFDKIAARVGDVWLVPGGLPHAIGEGILMLEVMEPSDLVVRCEFEREGVVVPPDARFMQSDVDLAMRIFDYTPLSVAQVEAKYKIAPQRLSGNKERLIGPAQTECFSVARVMVEGRQDISSAGCLQLGVVASGSGSIRVGEQTLPLRQGGRFLLASAPFEGELTSDDSLQILLCSPGR